MNFVGHLSSALQKEKKELKKEGQRERHEQSELCPASPKRLAIGLKSISHNGKN